MVNTETLERVIKDCNLTLDSGHIEKLTLKQVKELIDSLLNWMEENYSDELTTFILGESISRELKKSDTTPNHIVEKYQNELQLSKLKLPKGFKEIDRDTIKTDNGEATYVYAKSESDGTYGFQILNGKEYPFSRLGKITDPKSRIGIVLRILPRNDIFTKTDISNLKLNNSVVRNSVSGIKLKAIVDILEIEDYLIRYDKPLYERRGATGYFVNAERIHELEVETNGRETTASNPQEVKDNSPKLLSASI